MSGFYVYIFELITYFNLHCHYKNYFNWGREMVINVFVLLDICMITGNYNEMAINKNAGKI